MRANIIIHSVNGNIYLIGEALKEKLEEKGADARMYRIEDPDLHIAASKSNEANEYYEDIMSLPVATGEKLKNGDAIILGCPALFSLPSAEMKAFMDEAEPFVESRELAGKLFYCFTSTKSGKDAGESAANGLLLWADELGMEISDATPIIHEDSSLMASRPGISMDEQAERAAEEIVSFFSEE